LKFERSIGLDDCMDERLAHLNRLSVGNAHVLPSPE
jgi:hypothetical protein